MTQKEKLIEVLQLAPRKYMAYDEYADYLLTNGVIVPPCKVGDTVYAIVAAKVHSFVVVHIHGRFSGDNVRFDYTAYGEEYPIYFDDAGIGKTVFKTREEAEAALKGGEG